MKKCFFIIAVSVFLFSCAEIERDNPYDMLSPNYIEDPSKAGSSSSAAAGEPSSSGNEEPSSSSAGVSSSSLEALSSSEAESSSSKESPLSSGSVELSSSSAEPSSSSEAESSSSSSSSYGGLCAGFVEGTEIEHYGINKKLFCDERDGKKYMYVVIGERTWMAENLNYNASDSKCYSNSDSNCETYGRLYNWSTAMALPSNCNSSNSCENQIQSLHSGICPSGWHIPSTGNWGELSHYVDGTTGTNAGYASTTAGKYLKAASGWNPYSSIENLDTYGFSALPGGNGNSNGSFVNVGTVGYWWSTRQYGSVNYPELAYSRRMNHNANDAHWSTIGKPALLSVRCVKD